MSQLKMFKNEYQGGPCVEIFSASGRDPGSKWKLPSNGLEKEFDKEAKSYVFKLEGSSTSTRMTLPKDAKTSLSLLQRYLVLQCLVPHGGEFNIELAVTDLSSIKKRILLSTSFKDVSLTPLHAKIPLTILRKGIWANLCLDLASFVGETWKGQSFRSLESIAISAVCKVKRLFTMKAPPFDTSGDEQLFGISSDSETSFIPRHLQLPPDVSSITQVVNVAKVRAAAGSPDGPPQTNLNASLSESTAGLNAAIDATGRRKSNAGRRGNVSAKDQRLKPDEERKKLSTKEILFDQTPHPTDQIPHRSQASNCSKTAERTIDSVEVKSRDHRITKTEKTSKIPRLVDKTSSSSANVRTRSASKERKRSAAGSTPDKPLKKVGSEPNFKGLQLQGQTIESPRFRLSQSETSDKFQLAQSSDTKPSTTDNHNDNGLFLFSCPPKQRHPSPCWTESSTRPASASEDKLIDAKRDVHSSSSSSSNGPLKKFFDKDDAAFSRETRRRGSMAKPEDDFRLDLNDEETADARTISAGSREAHLQAPLPPRVRRRTGGHSAPRVGIADGGGDAGEGARSRDDVEETKAKTREKTATGASKENRPTRGTVRLSPTTRNLFQRPQFANFNYQSSDSDEDTRKREEEYEEAKDYEEILKRSLEDDGKNDRVEERRASAEEKASVTINSIAERLKYTNDKSASDSDFIAPVLNADFTDTLEKEMLESLKRQQQEELENSSSPSPRPKNIDKDKENPAAQIKATNKARKEAEIVPPKLDVSMESTSESGIDDEKQENSSLISTDSIEKHVYHVDSDSDHSDDTTLSTMKPPPQPSKYNFENEMQIGVSLPLPDTLIVRSSNPRDWGNLFSPPVTIAENTTTKSEANAPPKSKSDTVKPPAKSMEDEDNKRATSVEDGLDATTATENDEILELMFDPVLNCYFDPKTNKYYELC